ncbi:helix-turn-helix domain-containing protein [Morganella morganii]|uniref:helix-turn-helix domain-containing protein n=2 Tax=Morganellaceae TaxID=1903414 RepID=UPI00164978B2|nr:LysR family transcriptional regulator [Morganella morganii]
MQKTDSFSGITAFVAAAQHGSFTAAADKLGITKSAAGRRCVPPVAGLSAVLWIKAAAAKAIPSQIMVSTPKLRIIRPPAIAPRVIPRLENPIYRLLANSGVFPASRSSRVWLTISPDVCSIPQSTTTGTISRSEGP